MLKNSPQVQKDVLISLKKAQTQLNSVVKMVEDDRYCIHIIQQTKAVVGLIRSAEQKILSNHLRTCFKDGLEMKSKSKQEELVEEIIKVTSNL